MDQRFESLDIIALKHQECIERHKHTRGTRTISYHGIQCRYLIDLQLQPTDCMHTSPEFVAPYAFVAHHRDHHSMDKASPVKNSDILIKGLGVVHLAHFLQTLMIK